MTSSWFYRFGLILISLWLFSCDKERSQLFRWDMQSQAVATSMDFRELEVFAQSVERMSSGRLVITVHSAGSLTDGPDIFLAVSEGRIPMGNGWPNWWNGQHPAWSVMNAIPFDFMNLDASMMFFMVGDGMKIANEISQPQGVIWRPAWWAGMEFGLLSSSTITELSDLKGKRVRIGPGLPSEVLAAASGAYTIPLVPEEIRPALEAGEIFAVEWTTAFGVLDLDLQGLAPHAITPAVWQPSVLSDFLINEKAYNQLPQDLQEILETAMRAFSLTATLKLKMADFKALDELMRQGMTFTRWSATDLQKWRRSTDTVLESYREGDAISAHLLNEKQRFKTIYEDYYKWFGPYD
ncbi:TRAP transporter substrate-binding protein DctP [Teredinibacter haidensis]|uniref:TRAP transporter substrate-binding protein DctP n=1 Tax=Teredinibacter haidensis TaxID=2731755 RepID=UPI000948ECDE|nr:TRAP transporter substrate-binding protein DctP [Teredinibacter haidensis]